MMESNPILPDHDQDKESVNDVETQAAATRVADVEDGDCGCDVDEPWIQIGVLSHRTGVSTAQLRRWADEGRITSYRDRRKRRSRRFFPKYRATCQVMRIKAQMHRGPACDD